MEKISLEMLTEKSVSIKKQSYVVLNGDKYMVSTPHRCAYDNSEQGRIELHESLPEPYLSEVMAIWGDKPTIILSLEDI